ncbi:MAG: KTSC domain-containing protein [Betaproteobacteria bacterium]|jgi:hypothetical protein|nr:KTSC domain-containing protein [Betaproteobacteria bacterium]
MIDNMLSFLLPTSCPSSSQSKAGKTIGVSFMPQKRFNSGAIREARYDPSEKQLELSFNNGNVRVYRAVPGAVWERLCASPNPASYWEDRIAEEYPERKAASVSKAGTRAQLDALFGSAKGTEHEP